MRNTLCIFFKVSTVTKRENSVYPNTPSSLQESSLNQLELLSSLKASERKLLMYLASWES